MQYKVKLILNVIVSLQTLETMVAAVKKGKPVNEAEIPPPVATGGPSAAPPPPVPTRPAPPVPTRPKLTSSDQQVGSEATTPPDAVLDIITPTGEEEHSSSTIAPSLSSLPSPEELTVEPAQSESNQTHGQFVLDYISYSRFIKYSDL